MTPPEAVLRADWPAPGGVHACTTLRHGLGMSSAPFDTFNLGTRCGDAIDDVLRNRALLADALVLPSPPRWLRQVHGTGVVRFDAPTPGDRTTTLGDDEPEADAAVTSAPGTVLAVLTADCLPVVLRARDGSEVGIAHAGWRGLCAGVLEATVAAMRAAPSQLSAWFGPAAGPQAYEVGEEVFDAFASRDARACQAFVQTRPGHWRVDLYALARQRLADAGVRDVHGGGLCTISDPTRFYSHRRDARTGRMATLAWIDPAPR